MSACVCPVDCGRIIRYADNPCPIHGKNRPGQGAVGPVNETPGETRTHVEETVRALRSYNNTLVRDAADIIERQQLSIERRDERIEVLEGDKRNMSTQRETSATSTFPIGALVQLNSGSPTMTITDTDRRVVRHDADGNQIWQTTLFTLWITPDSARHNLAAPSECFKEVKA